jgi:hypothetical protein
MAAPADTESPPYRAAVAVAAFVLSVYVLTLAPTVTFWDAGEFIAAIKTLGVPHPPGTPLFVLIGHVWAMLVPVGEYAVRTNLLSAVCSAASAGFLFLVVHEALRGSGSDAEPKWLGTGGPAAAAVVAAFTFTHWQNSNETEVYAVATLMIAMMTWLAVLWRRRRDTERAPRLLLLTLYLAGLAIGNHLLALLVGPATVVFLCVTLRADPAPDRERRRREWAQVAVVAGVWALLIGCGLGNTTLAIAGGCGFILAGALAAASGAGTFAVLALLLAAVGVTPYLFLFLRAAQHPAINEAAPATIDALLAVIRRAQYPVRTPLDDPTMPHGPGNSGRTLVLLAIQLADYAVYFGWQWAKSIPSSVGQILATLAFAALGARGMWTHRRADCGTWWLLLGIFLVTGFGLAFYMNFKPGLGRWYHIYPRGDDHEVRERDYFFVISFLVWGLWAGIGLAATARTFARRAARPYRWLAPAVLLLALAPLLLNWTAARRRGGPDERLAADVAYDLLNSVPPYGILFTYGDNDTFPLWWAQEVAGIRRDVTVVCLALANADWYMRQLRDTPPDPLDQATLPAVWKGRVVSRPDRPLHALDDEAIADAMGGYLAPVAQTIPLGPLTRAIDSGAVLYPNEVLVLDIVRQNLGRRPIVWSVTAGRDFAGLGAYVVQRGLGFELLAASPDTGVATGISRVAAGPPVDVLFTERLLWETYRYGGLLEAGTRRLESTSAGFAVGLALPYVQLVYWYADRRDQGVGVSAVEAQRRLDRAADRAIQLSPEPEMEATLAELRHPGK